MIFDIEPIVKARPRVTKWGAYTPKRTADFENLLRQLALDEWSKQHGVGFLDMPLKVRIRLILKRPKKPSNPYPRGDTDNYAKAVNDALNGIVWDDDVQIVDERTTKEYGEKGRIEITVREHQGPLVFE